MASNVAVNVLKQRIFQIPIIKRQFSRSIIVYNQQNPPTSTGTQNIEQSNEFNVNVNVPGLSTAVLTTEEPVGPGAAKNAEYKVPEYFNYNKTSYFEAEIEMLQFRCEQPSAVRK